MPAGKATLCFVVVWKPRVQLVEVAYARAGRFAVLLGLRAGCEMIKADFGGGYRLGAIGGACGNEFAESVCGGAVAVAYGVGHRAVVGREIAGEEDGQRHIVFVCAALYNLPSLGYQGQIGGLAERQQDRVAGNLERAVANHWTAPSAGIGFTHVDFSESHATDAALAQDGERLALEQNAHAFFEGLLNLFSYGRHLLTGSAVDDADIFSA